MDIRVFSEDWPLREAFTISRGAKTLAEVIRVVVTDRDGVRGQGEAVPYKRYGEDRASLVGDIERMAAGLNAPLTRENLHQHLPSGAARNAVDCALWDIALQRGEADQVKQRLEALATGSLPTAITIPLAPAREMHDKALALKDVPLIKLKLDGEMVAERLRAVRAAAPLPKLIIDPNEGFTYEQLESLVPVLEETRVSLIEQPLPAGDDEALRGWRHAIPICADESCHTAADLMRLKPLYQAVNIKLDKTGGLTEARVLHAAARAAGMGVMVGCMVATSLAMLPALVIGVDADFVDLDGPVFLREDRPGGLDITHGMIRLDPLPLWGFGRSL